ncbi:hypothetical protein LZ017_09435 [Pelomonas sp. CA6]|uniref:hypothetical protein n=1 Tax=Pelomonas sp. CA6 TaxID=2907999 RepID=UPI001F4C101B|nr:hypothetical protein [Pelomonas sp. CA6]MCH7343599.1 hypothetical protein [Pelomonas sp. CA6]
MDASLKTLMTAIAAVASAFVLALWLAEQTDPVDTHRVLAQRQSAPVSGATLHGPARASQPRG